MPDDVLEEGFLGQLQDLRRLELLHKRSLNFHRRAQGVFPALDFQPGFEFYGVFGENDDIVEIVDLLAGKIELEMDVFPF